MATKKAKCSTRGCKNNPKGRTYCASCRSKQSRQKDPVRYAYNNLVNRARQRPKEITLTLEEFRQWVIDEQFKIGKHSIDRKDNTQGYHLWNIQKLPLQENIRKYWDHDRYQMPTEVDPEPLTGYQPISEDLTF